MFGSRNHVGAVKERDRHIPGLQGRALIESSSEQVQSAAPTTAVTPVSMQAVLPIAPPPRPQALNAPSPAVHSSQGDQSDGWKAPIGRPARVPSGGPKRRHFDALGVALASDWSSVVGDGDRWVMGLLQARTNLSFKLWSGLGCEWQMYGGQVRWFDSRITLLEKGQIAGRQTRIKRLSHDRCKEKVQKKRYFCSL